MPKMLTDSDFARLQEHADAGDRIAYYEQLAAWGYRYPELALGVVNNDTTAGSIANIFFLKSAALEQVDIDSSTLATIGLELMRADLAARLSDAPLHPGEELTYDVVQIYHESVFNSHGVSGDAWTPNKALNWLTTTAEKQALWDDLLSGGPTDTAAAIHAALVNVSDPEVSSYELLIADVAAQSLLAESNDYGNYDLTLDTGGLLIGNDPSDDLESGTEAGDVIMGFAGEDELRGHDGDDRLYGGWDNDLLIGGAGHDRLDGGSDDDNIFAGTRETDSAIPLGVKTVDQDDDLIFGGDGVDTVFIAGGDDIVSLGDGNDVIHITSLPQDGLLTPSGTAVIWGGAGADVFDFQTAAHVLLLDVGADLNDSTLAALSTGKLFDYMNSLAGENPYTHIILNPDASDRFQLNGLDLTSGSLDETTVPTISTEFLWDGDMLQSNVSAVTDTLVNTITREFVMEGDSDVKINIRESALGNSFNIHVQSNPLLNLTIGGFYDGAGGISVVGDGIDYEEHSHQETHSVVVTDWFTFDVDGEVFSLPVEWNRTGLLSSTPDVPFLGTGLKPQNYETSSIPTTSLLNFLEIVVPGTPSNNFFAGGNGGERFMGGLGSDSIDYSTSTSSVMVDLVKGTGHGGLAAHDRYRSIENVIGSDYADVITLSKDNNQITGGDGDDVFLLVSGGIDTIDGGNGFDMTLLLANAADYQWSQESDGRYTAAGPASSQTTFDGVELFVFADNTVWSISDVASHLGLMV
ncbi:hypothetical protein KX729_32775 [Rhizobium sp. XQZ8]|uniref:calcium-binding protein n=1 Tax=Rhizobium populisoli TaxID=2859785 RepID=UPI001CA56DEB|nr:calcium-binding protein [Rhizobium populisoli]MBW6426133.1 hypothetical protein [Rhizobium populisoli]